MRARERWLDMGPSRRVPQARWRSQIGTFLIVVGTVAIVWWSISNNGDDGANRAADLAATLEQILPSCDLFDPYFERERTRTTIFLPEVIPKPPSVKIGNRECYGNNTLLRVAVVEFDNEVEASVWVEQTKASLQDIGISAPSLNHRYYGVDERVQSYLSLDDNYLYCFDLFPEQLNFGRGQFEIVRIWRFVAEILIYDCIGNDNGYSAAFKDLATFRERQVIPFGDSDPMVEIGRFSLDEVSQEMRRVVADLSPKKVPILDRS